MMYELFFLGEATPFLYPLLMAVLALGTILAGAALAPRRVLSRGHAAILGVTAAVLGLLVGRSVYCAINWYEVFLDELGEFTGIGAFFDPRLGSCSIIGVLAGVLLAVPVTAALTKENAAVLLDAAVVPALVMYILARIIEPLSGQGNGILLELEVSVCWMEAVLTAVLLGCIPFLRRCSGKPGTLAQYALVLWSLAQILPESLRCDAALKVFVFARVTHLGLAFLLGIVLIRLLVTGAMRGLSVKDILVDAIAFAAGIGVCIGTLFALDKSNLPKLLIYAVMLLALLGLGCIECRRIHREDVR